jgi:ABC-type sugar transport system substrate-binding protein
MNRRHRWVTASILVLLAVVAGCAGVYDNLVPADKGQMTVETLVNNYQNYNVYYLGNFSIPYAVLFDPKEDGKTVKVGDRWEKVPSQDTASKQVGQISTLIGRGVNMPRLWKLVGPDGSLFGYVYTAATQLSSNVVDGNTMFVGNN